ncbi:hypothetical protein ANCCAN_21972 [Ancylostoma caninum]|uniref:Ribosomal RNA-processing protein 8 n=1 Tax=Ancylostoma caninum TaxID=29170 RepID=A0A368FJ15_ANCCA|nr:hypothetical protein ANCCAN_21972 [Ancylostoma caninum]
MQVLPTSVESGISKKKKKKRKKHTIQEEGVPADGKTETTPVQDGYKKLEAGRFRFLNEQLYTMTGGEALEYFRQDPNAFRCYHNGFAEQVKKWPTHPLDVIIRWLKAKQNQLVVYDLGCGDAKIAAAVGDIHKVRSFDLVAVNDMVTECDMAHLPVEDSVADIVVFCLSLMGTNITDYIKEARRVLKMGGVLKIAEVVSRFVNVKLFCSAVCKLGFVSTEKKQLTDYFTLMEFRKIEKVENKRPFGLKLKPCVYKKR